MVTTTPTRILVVDDDVTVAEVLTRYLEREGFAVDTVGDGEAAVESATALAPDLVVLDLMLPGIDGFEVYRRLRAGGSREVPVVMLTARGDEGDRVAGLELGADDYVVKPFSPRELTARVKAVLRRAQSGRADGEAENAVLRVGGVEVDNAARVARVDGQEITLTAREFDLLAFLACYPDQVFRREELFERVWGWTFGDTATVTVHVRRLREKVEPDPSAPTRIVTVWGVGYRFQA